MTLEQQWLTVGYMLLAGVVLGVWFDFFRALAIRLQATKLLVWLFDCVYWMSATLLICRFLFESNQGQFKISIFLFIFVGGFLYFRIFSSRLLKIMLCLLLPITWTMRKGWNIACLAIRTILPKK